MILSVTRIISGGQTGADRAALDFALEHSFQCGGWCPAGRKAEDGSIPEHYPLTETSTPRYPERTERNILESDGTIIFCVGDLFDTGTRLTENFCRQHSKSCLIVHLDQEAALQVKRVIQWLTKEKIKILNVAGPRESFQPGIYEKSKEFLELLLSKV